MATGQWQSGWLVESSGNPHGNFEMVTRFDYGRPEHYWRDNGAPDRPWRGPNRIGGDDARGFWAGCSLMLSTWGNLEMVGIEYLPQVRSGEIFHYFRNPLGWQGPHGVAAHDESVERFKSVAHLQRRSGNPPTFELLVAIESGTRGAAGILHLSRRDDPSAWRLVDHVAGSLTFEGVAAISSSFGGNLEVLACAGGHLYFLWQGDRGWSQPAVVGTGSGRPALTQSSFGKTGNFEAIAPAPHGSDGLLFYWRNNDAKGLPWSKPQQIPGSAGHGGYDDVTLIQSSYNGHLEVLARRRQSPIVDFYWRDHGPSWIWHGPAPLR